MSASFVSTCKACRARGLVLGLCLNVLLAWEGLPVGPMPEIGIIVPTDSVLLGDTMSAVAVALNGDGAPLTNVAWSAMTTGVLEVSSLGVVVGRKVGTAAVTAAMGNRVASRVLRVVAPHGGWSEIGVDCGRRRSDAVWCWDRTEDGPKGPLARLPFESAGEYYPGPLVLPFDCVLDEVGRAFCRGNNFMGQLGTGDTELRETFVAVSGNARFRELDLESAHACGITIQGELLCWGANMTGQLGREGGGAVCRRTRPVSCHLSPIEVPLPGPAAAVTVNGDINHEGDGFTCAVLVDHRTYCWGANQYGQSGRDRSVAWFAEPHEVAGAPPLREIDAGNNHVCGIDLSDLVWCWGRGNGGLGVRLLGTPEYECWSADVVFACTSRPVRIDSDLRFLDVAASYDVSCGTTLFGGTYCWGDNQSGQLGTGVKGGDHGGNITEPVAVASPVRFRELAASHSVNCGITPAGSAYCWGGGQATPTRVPDPPMN